MYKRFGRAGVGDAIDKAAASAALREVKGMMRSTVRLGCAWALLCWMALGVWAQAARTEARLGVGDPAPSLKISEWVKGEPVTEFQKGRVYVVEFWATWCPPCKKSIPHLTELQEKHKGSVTVIGISAKDGNGETIEKVRSYVEKAGDTMAYTVAFDDGSQTNRAYMVAARQRGIPAAFVVDQEGKIAWIGHPMSGLDAVLEKLTAGTFNAGADAKGEALAREIRTEIQEGRHDDAMVKIDELVALDAARYGQYAAYKFAYILAKKSDRAGAYAYARQASAGPIKENAAALSGIAQAIVADPEKPMRDLDLALELARQGVAVSKEKDAGALESLALVCHEKGLRDEAVSTQKKAIALSRPEKRGEMEKSLAKYEQGQ